MEIDCCTASDHDCYYCTGHHADPLSAFFAVSGREAYAEIYSVSGKGAAARSVRDAGCILPEKRASRQLRTAGDYFHWDCDNTSLLETADVVIHCRRHRMLYAAGAVCVCMRMSGCYVVFC